MTRNTQLAFVLCLGSAFALWTLWCVLMVVFESPFDHPVLRAVARFAAFVVPGFVWKRTAQPADTDPFRVVTHARRGLIVGLVVSACWAAVHMGQQFSVPGTTHAWLNVILLSPMAEEFLFRCVAIDWLAGRTSAWKSIGISAVLFSLIHLPWWVVSGEKSAAEICQLLVIMLVYGIVFGLLYQRTKSIWACLIPHSVNNLIAVSLAS